MTESKAKTINFRLKEEEYQSVEDYVKRHPGIDSGISTFARGVVLKAVAKGSIANVGGRNIFNYNSERDNFSWSVKSDDGVEKVLVENLSVEFLGQLSKEIEVKLLERDEVLKKKLKGSVSIPREILE